MANPNLGSASNVYVNNANKHLSTTSNTLLVDNASASGKVFMLDSITVANTDAVNAVTITVRFNRIDLDVASSHELAANVSIPAASTLIVVDKSQGVSLLEAQSISLEAGTANKLKVYASWKELS